MGSKEAWQTLKRNLGLSDKDFPTYFITNRKPVYFNAKVDGDKIVIDKAKTNPNSCKIISQRKIDYKQFEGVYAKYEDYISGIKGVRQEICRSCANSTYIISLIHYLL